MFQINDVNFDSSFKNEQEFYFETMYLEEKSLIWHLYFSDQFLSEVHEKLGNLFIFLMKFCCTLMWNKYISHDILVCCALQVILFIRLPCGAFRRYFFIFKRMLFKAQCFCMCVRHPSRETSLIACYVTPKLFWVNVFIDVKPEAELLVEFCMCAN